MSWRSLVCFPDGDRESDLEYVLIYCRLYVTLCNTPDKKSFQSFLLESEMHYFILSFSTRLPYALCVMQLAYQPSIVVN
jgi:hypothetical protein